MTAPRFLECLGEILYIMSQAGRLLIPSRHDVALQIVGQPARDLARHFVQR
jgi:phosphatidylserine/phosphatidylglycerophosphate/cardiolipin synthase-like enzyme